MKVVVNKDIQDTADMCTVCAQSWNKAELGEFGLFLLPLVDLRCLGENLMEETGMKIFETNSILLHRISEVFRKAWLCKMYFFDNTLKDANRIAKEKEPD